MNIDQVQNPQVYRQRNAAKTVAKTVLVAGLAATGLALGAKNGKFAVNDNSSALAKKVLPYFDKAGNAILKLATTVKDKVVNSNAFKNVKAKLGEAGIDAKIQKGKESAIGFFKGVGEKAQAGVKKGGELFQELLGKVKGMFAKAPKVAADAASQTPFV